MYFAAKRSPLAEKDVNIQTKPRPSRRHLNQKSPQNLERRPSLSADPAISSVELPEKPYPGFGSRGTQPVTTSYYSWSDSIRQPSAPLSAIARLRPRPSPFPHDPESLRDKREPDAPTHHARKQTGESERISPVQQFGAAPKAKQNQLPEQLHRQTQPQEPTAAVDHLSGQMLTSYHVDQNQILLGHVQNRSPRMPSSHKGNSNSALRARQSANKVPAVRAESESIANAGDLPALPRPQRTFRHSTEVDESFKQNAEPESTSSLGRLLRDCDNALAVQSDQVASIPQLEERMSGESMVQTVETNSARIRSQGLLWRLSARQAPMVMTNSSMYPNLYRRRDLDGSEAEALEGNADNMESTQFDPVDEEEFNDFVDGGGEECDVLADFDKRYLGEPRADEAINFDVNEAFAHEQEAVPDEQQGRDEDADVFAGFWRPHRLY